MSDRQRGWQRRKLYKPPPISSSLPFYQNPLLNDEVASSTDLARIIAYMNQIHRPSTPPSDDSSKHVLSQPFIVSPSPEQIQFTLNPAVLTVSPYQPPVPPLYPATLDGYTGYGYGVQNALYDSYMRTAVDPIHVFDAPLSYPNSHSSAESSTMARSPTNLHSRSKKSVSRSASTSHIIRRWSMLHVPDETLAVELEQLRRITRIRQRKKSDKARSSFTRCNTLDQISASPSGAVPDRIRFPTKEDYFTHDPARADATLSGAFVYGGPDLRQKFWLADDDDDEARSDEDDFSDASDDDSDTPEDDPQTPPNIEVHQEQAWKVARKALFCCRELVRTEKAYFSKLVQLKDGQVILFVHFYSICLTFRFDAKTLTPPPSLLTSYLPALILASNTLLEHCSQDPTAYGISTAFLESSAQLEHALVAYCGIIGDIFSTKRASGRKLVRSPRTSGVADESKRATPPNDDDVSRNLSRKSLNSSSLQLSFFGFSDRRKTIPQMSKSSFDVSRPFAVVEAPPLPVPPPPIENELPQESKTTLRRSFSLFRRKTSSQMSSPVQANSKSMKASWRRFRSSSKTSVQSPINSNEATESPPLQVDWVPPRPTRPIPPVPQETPYTSELGELNQTTRTLRRRNRSASLQTHIAPTEPPPSTGWNTPNPMKRGGMSLDMNHVIGSFESSTRSSHNLLFGTGGRRERIPTVRDLAILPTQRVMRYVLLFKGS